VRCGDDLDKSRKLLLIPELQQVNFQLNSVNRKVKNPRRKKVVRQRRKLWLNTDQIH